MDTLCLYHISPHNVTVYPPPPSWPWINRCVSSAGNSVGGLRAYGPQVLHGNGPDPAGGPGPVGHRQRLVQVVPYLLSGRSQHRPAHQTALSVLAGERHQPLVHLDNPHPPTLTHYSSQQAPPPHANTDTRTVNTQRLYLNLQDRYAACTHPRVMSATQKIRKSPNSSTRRHLFRREKSAFFFPDQANST